MVANCTTKVLGRHKGLVWQAVLPPSKNKAPLKRHLLAFRTYRLFISSFFVFL